MRGVFDTNILIDALNGLEQARAVVEEYDETFVSIVTFMEVLAGAMTLEEERAARRLLATTTVVEVDAPLAEVVINLRKQKRMKLADAVVWATAVHVDGQLVTRDRGFPRDDGSIRFPYRL
jgi:predicted nucleic acid-binding protein